MAAPLAYTPTPLSVHSDPKWGHILHQDTHCTPSGWAEIYNNVVLCIHHSCILQYLAYPIIDMLRHRWVLFRAKITPQRDISFPICTQQQRFQINARRTWHGKGAKGVLAFAIVSKFAVIALQDTLPGADRDMMLYVLVDTKEWVKAQFLHDCRIDYALSC